MLAWRLFGSYPGSTPVNPDPLAPLADRQQLSTNNYLFSQAMILENTDDLRMTYRFGTAHNNAGGQIDMQLSTDLGATWPGTGTTLATSSGSLDLRDNTILLSTSGRKIFAYDKRSPWNSLNISAVVRYTDGAWADLASASEYFLPYYSGPETSVVSSPALQLPDDSIVIPGFANQSGGTVFSVLWRSTDDGETFSTPEIIAQHVAIDYQEPQIRIASDGEWICLLRSEWNHHTWRTTSPDGSPGSWSAPVDVNEMTGRPDFVEYLPGAWVQFGRYQTSADSPGYYALSFDKCQTWTTPVEIDPGETGLLMESAPVVTSSGVVKLAYALQHTPSICRMYIQTFST